MSLAIRINLLDWRAQAREAKRKRFIGLLVAAGLGAALLGGVLPVVITQHRITNQQARNQYLQTQIDAADRQLAEIQSLKQTRDALIRRMQIISNLQASRSAVVHYLDQIVATLPGGVYLTHLTQNKDITTLDGVAESNARVSQYMTNLGRSAWLRNPRLVVIKRDERDGRVRANFTLQVDSARPDTTTGGAP